MHRIQRMQRYARFVLLAFSLATAGVILAQGAIMLWARHELVPYEPVVAMHAANLAAGRGLYYDLNTYPYTVATYTPVYYVMTAALHRLGIPLLAAGRILSFGAFLGLIAVSWRLLRFYTSDCYATWAGTLLIAATANLTFWATVCRVDMLALLLALLAFEQYSRYRVDSRVARLLAAAALVLAAAFTKQTMLVAGGVIFLLVVRQHRLRGALFGAAVAASGVTLALLLNHATGRRFFDNVLYANLNPFSAAKFLQHAQYFVIAAGGMILLALAGVTRAIREGGQPLYVYLAAAAGALIVTAPKIGSDYNYHLEAMALLGLCAGWTMHRIDFFSRCFRGDRSAVTLLQIPLAFHLVLNLAVSGRQIVSRLLEEPARRQEYVALSRYLGSSPDPVLAIGQDSLLYAGRPVLVEPFMYGLMVRGGRVDPEPLRQDLARGRFSLVILSENVFVPPPGPRHPDLCTLPEVHLEELRRNYRLVGQVPGVMLDNFLYQPRILSN